jgi:N-acetyl-gamma-glutamyl-phosphate reductase
MTGPRLAVGVVGATGYAGGELCRLLLGHPAVTAVWPTARKPESFDRVHPNLRGCGLEFTTPEQLADRADRLDVVFFATPSGEAMRLAGHFLSAGARVVDLSPDLRFADGDLYERVYGAEQRAPDLARRAVCGITELFRPALAGSDLVANPGCYVITAVLGLVPLLRAGWVDPTAPIHVHALNGTTGAGTAPRSDLQHAEMSESVLAYSLQGHRHGPELELRLGEVAGRPVRVELTTAHGNFRRGIHAHLSVPLGGPGLPATPDRDATIDLYREHYGVGHDREHFVMVNDLRRRGSGTDKEYDLYPRLADVVGSNFCHLGVDVDAEHGTARVVAVTDNLVKGAAGSAVQNMNVMLGLDETAGLRHYAP